MNSFKSPAHPFSHPPQRSRKMATNPCPCGYQGSNIKQCRCSPVQVESYLGKISGPLLDRIAIHVNVRPVDVEAWAGAHGFSRQSSATLRDQATAARERQRQRFNGTSGVDCNARISERSFAAFCPMDPAAERLFMLVQKSLLVSARARGHIVRIARTIADLEGSERIAERHVAEV